MASAVWRKAGLSMTGTTLRPASCFIPSISSFPFFSTFCRSRGRFPRPFSPPLQTPPVPKKVPFAVSAHGRTWQDPYHWMSNTNDPDLSTYLNQENTYARAFMADIRHVQQTLFSEMANRMPAKISTPPERWGPWLYYQYIPEGKEYPVLCRRLAVDQQSGWVKTLVSYLGGTYGGEEVLLDWNVTAEQCGYVHVGACRVSPDHRFLAYTLDTTGNEQFVLRIKDLKSGLSLPQSRVDGIVSLAWAQDGCTLFYTISDANQRPNSVFCTKVGSDSIIDVPIFTENDSGYCVDITSTKDGRFVTVNSNSRTSSEEGTWLLHVYVIDATKPLEGLKKIRKRASGVQYFLEHHHGIFYILTNAPLGDDEKLTCGELYLAKCPIKDIHLNDWQSIILPSENVSLHDMDIFDRHLVLFLNKNGSPVICSIDMPIDASCKTRAEIDDLNPWYLPQPSSLCSIAPGSNHDFMNSVYRVVLSSPVMPDFVVDYDMSKRLFSIIHQEVVLNQSTSSFQGQGIFDMSDYKHVEAHKNERYFHTYEEVKWKDFASAYFCERKEVISHDGAMVPLTILHSRKAWQKGQSPGIVQVYGTYGEVLDKNWSADRLSLLDRGWVVAFADVRGGGGGDSSWHKSGTRLSKLNSVYDFVSCGKYLVDEGYVHRDHLGAIASSAGCLLVGAASNMCPGLLRAAILKVPFLDVCNTLLDPNLPLTELDYEEFGNPLIRSHFEYIFGYSPYDNIPPDACLPSMLITASFHDSRVGVWEAAKWVAKVRDSTCPDCSQSVLLKTNMSGGHFGEGGRFGGCDETAYEYAFMMKVMGFLDSSK